MNFIFQICSENIECSIKCQKKFFLKTQNLSYFTCADLHQYIKWKFCISLNESATLRLLKVNSERVTNVSVNSKMFNSSPRADFS